jgi:hypothetical protein
MRDEIADKYVKQTSFTLQRYKLEELCFSLEEQTALSLIRHCYGCNYIESVEILNLIKQRGKM